ncbi:hypothetical protein Scep_006663 [Stephania cephalantha]|uniref:Uncharacterized protein n=1 Tax=Stephania cephalantha TaxID=152367 RepID=A0AAP0K8E2_9MAGN
MDNEMEQNQVEQGWRAKKKKKRKQSSWLWCYNTSLGAMAPPASLWSPSSCS